MPHMPRRLASHALHIIIISKTLNIYIQVKICLFLTADFILFYSFTYYFDWLLPELAFLGACFFHAAITLRNFLFLFCKIILSKK